MPEPEQRRYARVNISWPVIVEAGSRLLHVHTLNVSRGGAKVGLTEPLKVGTLAHLYFHRPNEPPLDVPAMVWRTDPDGVAFLFIGNNQESLTPASPS